MPGVQTDQEGGTFRKSSRNCEAVPWWCPWFFQTHTDWMKVDTIVTEQYWTYPLVVRTWVGWDNTCGSLYHSHRRIEADPGRAHQTSAPETNYRIHSGGKWRETHIVLWGSTHVAALALNALPAVSLHGGHHHRSELQAGWVACLQNDVYNFILRHRFLLFHLQNWTEANPIQVTHLNGRSQSRTPALLTGQSCGWFWSLPSRSHSNC